MHVCRLFTSMFLCLVNRSQAKRVICVFFNSLKVFNSGTCASNTRSMTTCWRRRTGRWWEQFTVTRTTPSAWTRRCPSDPWERWSRCAPPSCLTNSRRVVSRPPLKLSNHYETAWREWRAMHTLNDSALWQTWRKIVSHLLALRSSDLEYHL